PPTARSRGRAPLPPTSPAAARSTSAPRRGASARPVTCSPRCPPRRAPRRRSAAPAPPLAASMRRRRAPCRPARPRAAGPRAPWRGASRRRSRGRAPGARAASSRAAPRAPRSGFASRRSRRCRLRRADLGERAPEHPLGPAGLVEVLRDPAEPERPAGAEEERGVDVLRLGHDAFLEQVTDLVGDGFEGGLEDLVLAFLLVALDDDLVLADELDEREHRDRVEEVDADVGAHLGDRKARRVRGEDAFGGDVLAELGEDLLLDLELLEDGLEDEVAVCEVFVAGGGRDER